MRNARRQRWGKEERIKYEHGLYERVEKGKGETYKMNEKQEGVAKGVKGDTGE